MLVWNYSGVGLSEAFTRTEVTTVVTIKDRAAFIITNKGILDWVHKCDLKKT